MRQIKWRAMVAAAATIVITMAAGCGATATTDKAGGSGGSEVRVLRFVQPNQTEPPAQLAVWAKVVEARSGGTVKIEFLNGWRVGEANFEQGTIDDVKAGKIDGAWVGARVFDTIGVNSFQALLAPLLVDSHDLQGKVFQAGLPEQMMTGLDKVDLVGIGVLPGPLRKILGVTKPYVEPDDFRGATVGIQVSGVAATTFETLGATVRPVPSGRSLGGLDAYEQQLSSIASNNFAATAKYVTGNVNFWPRPLVLFTSHKVADSLTAEQLDVLREAAKLALPDALDASRTEDARAVTPLCAAGMTLPAASGVDLAALRKALEPVYEELSIDPQIASQIAAIQKLKTELGRAPDSAACEESKTTKLGSDLAGEYRWTLTKEDALKYGTDEDKTPGALESNYPSTFTTKLQDGRWTQSQSADSGVATGRYEVFRDRIVFDWDTGPKLSFTYRASSRGDLTLKPIHPMAAGDAFVWSTKKWVRE